MSVDVGGMAIQALIVPGEGEVTRPGLESVPQVKSALEVGLCPPLPPDNDRRGAATLIHVILDHINVTPKNRLEMGVESPKKFLPKSALLCGGVGCVDSHKAHVAKVIILKFNPDSTTTRKNAR